MGFVRLSVFLLLFCFSAFPNLCTQYLFNEPQDTFLTSNHQDVATLIPDLDRKQDILLMLWPNGHANLYVGRQTWDWSGAYSVKQGGRAAIQGLAVRIRLGHAKFEELNRSIEAKKYESIWTRSCLHNTLLFLYQNGIQLRGGIPLMTTNLLHRLKEGFHDPSGKAFRTTRHWMRHRSFKKFKETFLRDFRDASLWMVPSLFQNWGLTDEEFVAFLRKTIPRPAITRIEAAVIQGDHYAISRQDREIALKAFNKFEVKIFDAIKQVYGVGSSEALFYYSEHPSEFPTEFFRNAMAQLP